MNKQRKEQSSTEIETRKTVLPERQQIDETFFGDAFTSEDVKLEDIILIQGNHPLKKEMPGLFDGQLVLGSIPLIEPLEVIFVKANFLVDKFSPASLDANERLAKGSVYQGTLSRKELYNLGVDFSRENLNKNGICQHGNDFYQTKKVLVFVVRGVPYRVTFKSLAKQSNAASIFNVINGTYRKLGLDTPLECVFSLSSVLKEGANASYYAFNLAYSRRTTEEEYLNALQFVSVDPNNSTFLSEDNS